MMKLYPLIINGGQGQCPLAEVTKINGGQGQCPLAEVTKISLFKELREGMPAPQLRQ